MARVLLQNVCKLYGERGAKEVEAVKDLNLEIPDGSFFALLGPSGCGKTSTLRMIAGLEQITSGSILIGDRLVNHLPPKDRNIAMAFETYALYPPLTVFENIAFPLRVRGYSEVKIEARVREVARMLDIEDILGRMPVHLGGGQMQLVTVARAIVRDADVFLMDEPLSHLDAEQRHRMRIELKRIHSMLRSTMVFVTHDQLEALAMADYVAVMNLGELQQIGTPEKIFGAPVNLFVADFVGEPAINFVDVTPSARNGEWCLRAEDGSIEVAANGDLQRLLAGAPAELVLGVRPSHVRVSLRDNPAYPIRGSLYVFEGLGDEGLVTAKVGNHLVRAITSPDLRLEADQPLWLAFDPETLHVFDRKTTRSLREAAS